ncbi:MAG: hypothetical protein VCE75_07155 [Alphaproteobacteria bacterium]
MLAAFTAAFFTQISVAEVDTRRHYTSSALGGALNGYFPFRGEDEVVNFAIGVHCAYTGANSKILPNDSLSHIEVLDYRFSGIGNGVPDLDFNSAG